METIGASSVSHIPSTHPETIDNLYMKNSGAVHQCTTTDANSGPTTQKIIVGTMNPLPFIRDVYLLVLLRVLTFASLTPTDLLLSLGIALLLDPLHIRLRNVRLNAGILSLRVCPGNTHPHWTQDRAGLQLSMMTEDVLCLPHPAATPRTLLEGMFDHQSGVVLEKIHMLFRWRNVSMSGPHPFKNV